MEETLNVIIFVAVAVIITIATCFTLYRMVIGPSIFDRAMAADILIAIFSIVVATDMIITRNTDNMTLLVVLAVVGFIGSVILSRYAERSRNVD